jgi:SAM-dependent methyltransferase
MIFDQAYAGRYDAFYRDKDYAAECDYLATLYARAGARPASILDLGCGTGAHALVLSQRGYRVTGVDRSPGMLAIARHKAHQAGADIRFVEGDLTAVNLGEKFDSVIAMFAVMGYQTTNQEFANACQCARRHLHPGGLFLFDCWNGFAVCQEKPAPRMKQVELGAGARAIRYSQSEIDYDRQVVTVHFKVLEITAGQVATEIEESHRMRFFFPMEIRQFLENAGFATIEAMPFLETDRPLQNHDWNMMVMARS